MNETANCRHRLAIRLLMSKDTDIVHSQTIGFGRKRLASRQQISMLQPETALAARERPYPARFRARISGKQP
jgi:hypothetical protein